MNGQLRWHVSHAFLYSFSVRDTATSLPPKRRIEPNKESRLPREKENIILQSFPNLSPTIVWRVTRPLADSMTKITNVRLVRDGNTECDQSHLPCRPFVELEQYGWPHPTQPKKTLLPLCHVYVRIFISIRPTNTALPIVILILWLEKDQQNNSFILGV